MMNAEKIFNTKSKTKVALLLLTAFPLILQAADKPAYWVGTDGKYVKSGNGECVRTIEWRKDAALAECEPNMTFAAKPAAKVAAAPAPAPVQVAKAAPMPTTVVEKISLTSDALFDLNQAILRPQGMEKLDGMIARISNSKSEVSLEKITVTGHADATGPESYNQTLSEKRAAAVKAYLIERGFASERIVMQGKGEAQPVATNKTASGRAQNRRVEVDIQAQMTTTSPGN